MTSRFVHPYHLGASIILVLGISDGCLCFYCICQNIHERNRADPDQMLHYAAPEQVLHRLVHYIQLRYFRMRSTSCPEVCFSMASTHVPEHFFLKGF